MPIYEAKDTRFDVFIDANLWHEAKVNKYNYSNGC